MFFAKKENGRDGGGTHSLDSCNMGDLLLGQASRQAKNYLSSEMTGRSSSKNKSSKMHKTNK